MSYKSILGGPALRPLLRTIATFAFNLFFNAKAVRPIRPGRIYSRALSQKTKIQSQKAYDWTSSELFPR
jgi:hypothetical protein